MKTEEKYNRMNLPTILQAYAQFCLRRGIDPDFVLNSDYSEKDKERLLSKMLDGVGVSDVEFIVSTHATGTTMEHLLRLVRKGFDIKQFYKNGMTQKQLMDAYKKYRMSSTCLPNDERQQGGIKDS